MFGLLTSNFPDSSLVFWRMASEFSGGNCWVRILKNVGTKPLQLKRTKCAVFMGEPQNSYVICPLHIPDQLSYN
jgi:hypothetical protein